MKRTTTKQAVIALLLLAVVAITYTACKKSYTQARPDYVVLGLHDFTIVNALGQHSLYIGDTVMIPLSINYDAQSLAAQELVSLSVSGLPAGITMDTTWVSKGYPSFNTTLKLYDTTAAGVTVGSYPITLTATGSSTGKKTFTFTLKVNNPPPCTAGIVGVYNYCNGACTSIYSDTITNDPSTPNKVWFSNFANSHRSVYGIMNCANMTLTVPSQTVNGITLSSATMNAYGHYIYGYMFVNSSGCNITMQ